MFAFVSENVYLNFLFTTKFLPGALTNRFTILSEIPLIDSYDVTYKSVKLKHKKMNRNSTLKGKITLIFTNSTFFSSYFIQAFSFALKHQFIQPALVKERERSQFHPSLNNPRSECRK